MANQRFFVWSIEGDGACLAWRLQAEGHEVVMRCDDPFMGQNLDGIVDKVHARPRIGDIIVFDGVGRGPLADELRDRGYCVVGASSLADKLELDRQFAEEFFADVGIQTPETRSFTSISDAIQFVSANPGRWVFKPSSNMDCAFTYCARDEMDMVNMLMYFQSVLGDGCDFVLQRFIEGVCVSTEGWFDGERWIEQAWNGTYEVKELCVGGCGPKTGCSWCVCWSYAQMPRIAEEINSKLTDALAQVGYIGPWDMNCVVADDGEIYCLEATPRFGYDAIEAYACLFKQSLGDMLIGLCEQDGLWPIASDEVGVAARMCIRPYPFGDQDHCASGEIPVRWRHEDESNLWLTGCCLPRRSKHVCSAPTDGMLGVATAVGQTERLYEACDALRSRLRRLMIPDLYWRDDIGQGVQEVWFKLAQLGFESPLSLGTPIFVEQVTDTDSEDDE